MLNDNGVRFTYREVRTNPLDESEIRRVLTLLGLGPAALLRTRDKANKELGLTGEESDDVLIGHMAEHPTLIQRPIGIADERAVVGRPPERLLELT